MTTKTIQHRDTNEGLYARLSDAINQAIRVIKDIHDDLPETADRPARVELLEALRGVRDTADTKHGINYTSLVSEEAYHDARNWFQRCYITTAWERTGENEVEWTTELVFKPAGKDGTGWVDLVVTAECWGSEGDEHTIVESFGLSFYEGESLYRAIGNAQSEANAFLRGIKRAYRI